SRPSSTTASWRALSTRASTRPTRSCAGSPRRGSTSTMSAACSRTKGLRPSPSPSTSSCPRWSRRAPSSPAAEIVTDLLERLLARDTTLWPEGNVADNRLGWLDVPRRMRDEAAELRQWAAGVRASHVVLLGMGGSSLGAEVLRASSNDERLVVLDTTDPATVAAAPVEDAFY